MTPDQDMIVKMQRTFDREFEKIVSGNPQPHLRPRFPSAPTVPVYRGYGRATVIKDASLVDMVEDWSRVRSPSRAMRRRRQGHRQNIRMAPAPRETVYSLDGGRVLVMHPSIAKGLRQAVSEGAPGQR